MAEGTVKQYNEAQRYGYIAPDGGDDVVFVEYSSIRMSGFRYLVEGMRVSFTVERDKHGLHATDVTPLSEFPRGPFGSG
ncbi:MAG: cold shock domain-containing protein [Actinomycetota bacterium]|nr:cold shock domain-containing protein [Actinomycetota bacterium]